MLQAADFSDLRGVAHRTKDSAVHPYAGGHRRGRCVSGFFEKIDAFYEFSTPSPHLKGVGSVKRPRFTPTPLHLRGNKTRHAIDAQNTPRLA